MMLTCPSCRSGLQVPEGTTAMVRCPTCKTVFSPPADVSPPAAESAPPKPVMLTCPTCRSGLQVPSGTTAMVRCPTCKTVFSPAAGLAPPEPKDEEPEEEAKPKKRKPVEDDEEEDEKPRRKKKQAAKESEDRDEPKEKNRDFDPDDPENEAKPKKRRRREDDSLSPEERKALKQAFARATVGCKLIWISIVLFMLSMVLIIGYSFQAAFADPNPAFLVAAGAVGLINWLLAAIGVGLCLSGPVSPGHWRYGIAAAVATGLHVLLLLILVGQGKEYSAGKTGEQGAIGGGGGAERWALIPTRLDTLTYYLTFILYRDQDMIPKGEMALSIVVGVAELIRTVLILMLLSCLARAAGDEELSHECTRAAGFASFGPGILAIGMLLFMVFMVETNAQGGTFSRIIFSTVVMGTYAILNGCMFPGLMVARETTDACEEPFQDRNPRV